MGNVSQQPTLYAENCCITIDLEWNNYEKKTIVTIQELSMNIKTQIFAQSAPKNRLKFSQRLVSLSLKIKCFLTIHLLRRKLLITISLIGGLNLGQADATNLPYVEKKSNKIKNVIVKLTLYKAFRRRAPQMRIRLSPLSLSLKRLEETYKQGRNAK